VTIWYHGCLWNRGLLDLKQSNLQAIPLKFNAACRKAINGMAVEAYPTLTSSSCLPDRSTYLRYKAYPYQADPTRARGLQCDNGSKEISKVHVSAYRQAQYRFY